MPSCPQSPEAALTKTSNSWVRAVLTYCRICFSRSQSVALIGRWRRTRALPAGLLVWDTVTLTESTKGEEWRVCRPPSNWQQDCAQTLCDTVSKHSGGQMKKIWWFMLTVLFCSNRTAGVGSYWMIHHTEKVLHCFVVHRLSFCSLWLQQNQPADWTVSVQTNPKNSAHQTVATLSSMLSIQQRVISVK